MAIPTLTVRTLDQAANLRLAASSVADASAFADAPGSLRLCHARFSRAQSAPGSGGDRK
jgi:hypothetical protein